MFQVQAITTEHRPFDVNLIVLIPGGGLNLHFLSQATDGTETSSQSVPAAVLFPAVVQTPQAAPAGGSTASPKPMEELDLLGKTLLQQSLPPESQQVKW